MVFVVFFLRHRGDTGGLLFHDEVELQDLFSVRFLRPLCGDDIAPVRVQDV